MRQNLMNTTNQERKEVKKMKKVLFILAALLMMANVAFATPIDPVTVNTPDGALTIGQMDWAPGSGLVINGNFFGPGGTSNPLDTKYQAFMSVFLDPTPAQQTVNTPNLNNTYEFTVTANIWENAIGLGGLSAVFLLQPDPTNLVNVYYDNSPDANVAAGTGFADGTLALQATPVFLLGNFTQLDTNGNGVLDNQDIGSGGSDILSVITFVDNSIFPTLHAGTLFFSHFIGTQNTPPEGVDTAMMWDGTIPDYFTPLVAGTTPFNTNDLLLKVDGNTHFSVPVPEPSTMILVGSGLIAFGFSAIRRRKQ